MFEEFFYHEQAIKKETRILKIGRSIKQEQLKTISNLGITFNYHYLPDLRILVGVHRNKPDGNVFTYDFIDVQTGLSLPRTKKTYLALRKVLDGYGAELGEHKPLDTEIWEYIRKKQRSYIKK